MQISCLSILYLLLYKILVDFALSVETMSWYLYGSCKQLTRDWLTSLGTTSLRAFYSLFQLGTRLLCSQVDISHYSDIIMGAIASQITSLTLVYPIVYSGADQRKYQSSASLAFVWGIHRRPVNSPHKWPVTRKNFHLMTSSCNPEYLQCGKIAWHHMMSLSLNEHNTSTCRISYWYLYLDMVTTNAPCNHLSCPHRPLWPASSIISCQPWSMSTTDRRSSRRKVWSPWMAAQIWLDISTDDRRWRVA